MPNCVPDHASLSTKGAYAPQPAMPQEKQEKGGGTVAKNEYASREADFIQIYPAISSDRNALNKRSHFLANDGTTSGTDCKA